MAETRDRKFVRSPRRRGVSLIEVMIALAITAVLLTAVAAAFDASFENYSENEEMVDALQGARILTHRIMTQVRRSTYLNVTSEGRRIQVEPAGENYQYIYVHVPVNNVVILTRMDLDTLVVQDLGVVENVTSFTIPSAQWRENPARLTVSMTLRAGDNTATLTESAVPRTTINF